MPKNNPPIDPSNELPRPHDMQLTDKPESAGELTPGFEAQMTAPKPKPAAADKPTLPYSAYVDKPSFFQRNRYLFLLLPLILFVISGAIATMIVSDAQRKEQMPRPTITQTVLRPTLPPSVVSPSSTTASPTVFCGGIANIQCPTDYSCQLDGGYPDAGGHCIADQTPGTALGVKPTDGPAAASADVVNLAKGDLAHTLGKDVDTISVVSVQEKEWSDSSLGCPKPGVMYMQVITPGYLVTLSDGTKEYSYHTDTKTRAISCTK